MARKSTKGFNALIEDKFGVKSASEILAKKGVEALTEELRKRGARRKSWFGKGAEEDIIELLEAVLADEADDIEGEAEDIADDAVEEGEATALAEAVEAISEVVEAVAEKVEALEEEMSKMRSKMRYDEDEEKSKMASSLRAIAKRLKAIENAPSAVNRRSYDDADDDLVIDLDEFKKRAPAHQTNGSGGIFGDLMKG